MFNGQYNKLIGFPLIIFGIVLLAVAIAPLLFPIFLIICGLYLINFGLKLCGKSSNMFMAHNFWSYRCWRR